MMMILGWGHLTPPWCNMMYSGVAGSSFRACQRTSSFTWGWNRDLGRYILDTKLTGAFKNELGHYSHMYWPRRHYTKPREKTGRHAHESIDNPRQSWFTIYIINVRLGHMQQFIISFLGCWPAVTRWCFTLERWVYEILIFMQQGWVQVYRVSHRIVQA